MLHAITWVSTGQDQLGKFESEKEKTFIHSLLVI
jgi:hypothetical protein